MPTLRKPKQPTIGELREQQFGNARVGDPGVLEGSWSCRSYG
jgi:hypothetical protein